jgi:protocatechuate 3,4-dioxygenase beta subunit
MTPHPSAVARACFRTLALAAAVLSTSWLGGAVASQPAPAEPQQRPNPRQIPRPGENRRLGPPRDTAPAPTGTARIRGRVVSADTGAPIRRAVLRLDMRELRQPGGRTTMTDVDGRYDIRDLPAGRYTISVSKAGFVTLQYGQRRPFEQGRPLEIADAQLLQGVDFALPRGGVITGRIVDEFGDAVAGAMVSALRYQNIRGRRRLTPTGQVDQTNDLGQYRVYGLPPGEYYVSGILRNQPFLMEDAQDTSGYTPTYFPGSASPAEAQRVSVPIGEEALADFALIPARLVKLTGTVLDSGGRPVTRGMVRLTQSDEVLGFFMANQPVGRIRDDGAFTIGGVAPGSYNLVVNSRDFGDQFDDAGMEFARMPVSVGDEDLAGLLITTTKGATATGQIVFENAPPSSEPTNVRVLLSPVDFEGAGFGMGPGGGGRVNADWTFELRNLFGRFTVNVVGLQGGATRSAAPGVQTGGSAWQVKAVYLGGQDIVDSGFEGRGQQRITGLQIVMTNQQTELSGTVTDAKSQTLKDYVVVAFPEDETKWTLPSMRYIRTARPDQDGTYRLNGLPPGEYLAAAVEYIETGSTGDPEILARLRAAATSVRLEEGEKKVLGLKLGHLE